MDKMKKVAKEEVKAHEKRMHAAKMAKVANQKKSSFTYKKGA